ncbi:hypothetical protein LUZ61_012786 [Rhynchospora tenuis]|uniref:RING-type domain-containing protein n=1 Tax=Rhynchospora tenuis TaxID=198213 RepID=A0AAD6A3J7_9POAL|nr:hypothetical protein LUZ61_012786 [Rhynchospora tenuis]
MDPPATTQITPHEHVVDMGSVSTSQQYNVPSTSDPNQNRSGTSTTTYNRNRRSPLNSGLWISIEVLVNVSQIIAAIIVLSLSRKERPQAPLFEWVIGYTVGCFATLPHLYWRYLHRNVNQNTGQGQEQSDTGQGTVREASLANGAHSSNVESSRETRRERQLSVVASNPRINALFDHFKMALDCFFAVWFVVGNIWIFGGHSSQDDAPNLYRLCIVFLTFSCIGYAMPFILCGVICCCLPCIISVMGFREDGANTRGASSESINALPIYKFKTKKRHRGSGSGSGAGSETGFEGGVLAPGTDKERVISAEDAVCCICLGKYANNDELRELPCLHVFHKDCVDKWLKINALCPLCKAEVGGPNSASQG